MANRLHLLALALAVFGAAGRLDAQQVGPYAPAQALATRMRDARPTAPTSYKMQGAIAGFVVGAVATAVVLYSGGSNSLCDSSSNQDAMNTGECIGVVAAGGAAGALAGYFIGGRIHRDVRWEIGALRSGVAPGLPALAITLRSSSGALLARKPHSNAYSH